MLIRRIFLHDTEVFGTVGVDVLDIEGDSDIDVVADCNFGTVDYFLANYYCCDIVHVCLNPVDTVVVVMIMVMAD